jgi:hypothetical protein
MDTIGAGAVIGGALFASLGGAIGLAWALLSLVFAAMTKKPGSR